MEPFQKRGRWYVNLWSADGKRYQEALGPDKDAAFAKFYRIMADGKPAEPDTPVAIILDQFVEWVKANRKPATFDWYLERVQSFKTYVDSIRGLNVNQLKPFHVDQWLAQKSFDKCGSTTKNGYVRAISRAFNWARKSGRLDKNPIAGMERPKAKRRERYITDDEWARIIAATKGPFRDYLDFAEETGARPPEIRAIESRHVNGNVVTLDRVESKGEFECRVIRLTPMAKAIVDRLSKQWPEGPVFRNSAGRPWKRYTLSSRFTDLRNKLKIAGLNAYILRHRWCTNALKRGVNPLTVATLMGHKSPAMVCQVYSHLVQENDFLDQELLKATTSKSVVAAVAPDNGQDHSA